MAFRQFRHHNATIQLNQFYWNRMRQLQRAIMHQSSPTFNR